MHAVMIECPQTGYEIPTGLRADTETFARSPVFVSRTYCAHCRTEHEWFAQNAWLHGQRKRRALSCEAA